MPVSTDTDARLTIPSAQAERPGESAPKKRGVVGRVSRGFQLTGLVYCGMTCFMGVAAIQGGANLLYGVFGLMIGVLLMSGVVRRILLKKLQVSREVPELCSVDLPFVVSYAFENSKRYLPSFSIGLKEIEPGLPFKNQPSAFCLHAAAGQTRSVRVELVSPTRGRYTLDRYQLYTSFPFGFYRRASIRQHKDTLLIAPPIGRVSDRLIAMCRSAEKSGSPVKPQRGGNDEFYGVREFRHGESPRRIYWRRSARSPGVLVAKEMTQAAPPRLLIMVDTYAPRISVVGASDLVQSLAAVEEGLAMAASLATRALDESLCVGCCVWGGDDWVHLPVQRGKRQIKDLLTILASAPRNSHEDAMRLLQAARGRIDSQTTGVLVSGTELQQNLADQSRGNLILLSAGSSLARASFNFDSAVNFQQCIPVGYDGGTLVDNTPGSSI